MTRKTGAASKEPNVNRKGFNIAVVLALIVLPVLSCREVPDLEPGAGSGAGAGSDVLQAARQVVEAFEAKDGRRLAQLVHPAKGVRFSPGAYVEVKSDVVFSRDQVIPFWRDRQTYTWGIADGTGDPIIMTPGQYCARYIMNRDFLRPFKAVSRTRLKSRTILI